ncbi:MAG: hypothetical protein JXA07_06765 [Spirochaetes bacterium]|nr:hypothetical protein [Spirochaetota bacterium]
MKKLIFISIFAWALLAPCLSFADVESVTMTPAGPTTLSNGRSYYCAGLLYTFHIRATDNDASAKADWNTIYVEFRQGVTPREDFTITIATDSGTGNGLDVINVQDLTGGIYNEIHYAVTVRFRWSCTAYAWGSNSVYTQVTSNIGASDNATNTFNYGVISDVRVLGFAQSGEAADARLNPWHNAFTVSGTIVYASGAEIITNTVPATEIASSALYLDGNPTAPDIDHSAAGATATPSFDVPELYCNDHSVALGTRTWTVRVSMATPGGPVVSDNSLTFNCNRIQVEWIRFENGGGVNTPYFLRSIAVAGTRLRVRASLENGGGAMAGTTTFVVTDTAAGGAHTYTVQISSGQHEATALIDPLPDAGDVASGTTVQIDYTVTAVYGGSYDGNAPPGVGQDSSVKIAGSGPYALYWDNTDGPGDNEPLYPPPAAFTTFTQAPSPTAASITFYWTPLSATLPAPAAHQNFDADFYTYRIYYRVSGDPTWLIVDRNTAGYANLGVITTTTEDITDLVPLTNYDYRFSAIDAFGNEVPLASQLSGTVSTTATTITVAISDGISQYDNASFINPDPAAHPVRDSAIRVQIKIVTTENMPERVEFIIADNDSDVPVSQFGNPAVPTSDNIIDDLPADQRWAIACIKQTSNTYEGYISSNHPLMRIGTNIRLIIATTVEGVTTYSDRSVESGPPGSYATDEWRFRVTKQALFIPYPTRVLNNVLTAQLPCCYPAFFLAVDSLVTIKVYDAKGRVIATLCENLYRPGGQNIKDLGWCGRNKDNNRVGPGLYYLHIKAVTIGNKTVLDKKMKVVVRH